MTKTSEQLKAVSPTLAGTIRQSLADTATDRFSDDDAQFLKFHGIYQGDDRDRRKTGKHYIFMVRCRIPGGVLTPSQYLACDALATQYSNGTLRVTSRQGLQFHGVVKRGLGPLVRGINNALLTTLSACGDVNRNVMAPPAPATNGVGALVHEHARQVAQAFSPRTAAYHSIWVDGRELKPHEPFTDPLYGATYLPRKFKVGFVIPPHNDVDIFANCCGFIAIANPSGKQLLGYNLVAGGGMGRSHGNHATFPRLADEIGFLPADKVVAVATAVLTIHRDFSDRTNRKHARLKYVLEEKGPAWFREELAKRLGFPLTPAHPVQFTTQSDPFGWHQQADGRWFLGLFVETGRIKGKLREALRQIIATYRPEIRLTPANNVILANLSSETRAGIDALLSGIDTGTALLRTSMACVALPTCGMAVTEAERYLPRLVGELETALAEVGLAGEPIHIRMTGCPNGCARPYLAEIAFVGKSPGLYQLWLGGNAASTRLNRLYRETVKDTAIVNELRPLFVRYRQERLAGEHFGDWCARSLWKD